MRGRHRTNQRETYFPIYVDSDKSMEKRRPRSAGGGRRRNQITEKEIESGYERMWKKKDTEEEENSTKMGVSFIGGGVGIRQFNVTTVGGGRGQSCDVFLSFTWTYIYLFIYLFLCVSLTLLLVASLAWLLGCCFHGDGLKLV